MTADDGLVGRYDVYNTLGAHILTTGDYNVEALPAGLYIVNGKKVLVRGR